MLIKPKAAINVFFFSFNNISCFLVLYMLYLFIMRSFYSYNLGTYAKDKVKSRVNTKKQSQISSSIGDLRDSKRVFAGGLRFDP